jgi:hypothetical protein
VNLPVRAPARGVVIMGLLDELKQQADSLARTQADEAASALELVQRADAALAKIYAFLDDFGKQLSVLKPASPRVFTLPGLGAFENLKLAEFFADYRKKMFEDREYLDYVHFQYQYIGPKSFEFVKNNISEKEQVEQHLRLANIKHSVDEFRNERGRATGGKFTVPGVITAVVRVDAKPDRPELVFALRNIERFDTLKLTFPTANVDDSLLDELGKLILARPSQFVRRGEIAL